LISLAHCLLNLFTQCFFPTPMSGHHFSFYIERKISVINHKCSPQIFSFLHRLLVWLVIDYSAGISPLYFHRRRNGCGWSDGHSALFCDVMHISFSIITRACPKVNFTIWQTISGKGQLENILDSDCYVRCQSLSPFFL
jgi:hypothetical protein